jgi:proline iminopeptidase
LFCFDPDRYLQRFEKTLEGTRLSAYAERALVAADKRYPRKQSQEYTEISAKTLILSGTLDWACPTEVSERMHTGIPGSILSLYANAGHLLWIEQPKRFFAELSHFLGDVQ